MSIISNCTVVCRTFHIAHCSVSECHGVRFRFRSQMASAGKESEVGIRIWISGTGTSISFSVELRLTDNDKLHETSGPSPITAYVSLLKLIFTYSVGTLYVTEADIHIT